MKQEEKNMGVIVVLTTCAYYYAVYTNEIEYSSGVALGITIVLCLAGISYALDKKDEPTKIKVEIEESD